MAAPSPEVRPATEAGDHEAVAEALALALAADPAWAHPLPDDASRAERLLTFFTAEIDNLPAHLEASTDRSRLLYERHGFDHADTFHMPAAGPPPREMWREPLRRRSRWA